MSLRLVSSARNLRDQFKGGNSSQTANSNNLATASSGSSIFTANSGISNTKTLDPSGMTSAGSILSRQGTLLRAQSNGNLRRNKSLQKKSHLGRGDPHHSPMPDLSMEVTRVIVKRCIKEIRERGTFFCSPAAGLTTKGILRQVQMAQSKEVVIDTLRLILDDDSNTQLSLLRQVDIHLVAHAMKWAIRYSEETLVTYADYQALYLDQDRSFSRFVHDLPPTNRAILLDLFSLCADVTLLAHLNGMTLVVVAKAISLSIMAEPEREFTTFDASLQQRNQWGAACEDLLRAFLRIKTTHDLAKIEQDDGIDENRYVDNITREVKSARQRSNETGAMPNMSMYSRPDMPVPSSAGSMPGWSSTMTPTGSMARPVNGYFDHVPTPRSASPLSQQSSSIHDSSLSRSHSLAKSNSSRSRPLSPAIPYESEKHEYEEMMQDQSHLGRLRHQSRQSLMPVYDKDRRRSSVADMESLYMLPVDPSEDGYESEPEPSHKSLVLEFSDGLGWDFSKLDDLQMDDSSKDSQQSGVHRSNSSSSNGSTSTKGTQNVTPSFGGDDQFLLQRSVTTGNKARLGHAIHPDHTSPSMNPQRAKRNSLLRRSVSLDPHTMHGRVHKKPNELRQDILTRELAIQAERSQVAEDIRTRLLQSKHNIPPGSASPTGSAFSLESSPVDLDRPAIPTRSASQGLGRSMSRSTPAEANLQINVGSLPPRHNSAGMGVTDELTPVSNPSSNSSIASPKPPQPSSNNTTERSAEIVSRPKDAEVCVHFSPITPVSPKAEMRSKFQESFSDRPMSPPSGYAHGYPSDAGSRHNRSPSTKSSQGSRMSPSSSTMSSPMQTKSLSRSNSKTLVPPHPQQQLQHSATFSGTSSAPVSSAAVPEGKFKASGFIRALSYKLRSKQSDEQLKPVKINNQVVSTAPPVAPAVSVQPPRLELSFLGDLGGPTTSIAPAGPAAHPLNDSHLPPATAPATLLRLNGSSNSGADTIEGWRRAAQDTLPVPSTPIDRSGSDHPKGFTGARRSSGTLFGSGNVAVREQRRKSRMLASSPRSSPSSQSYLQANSSKADGKRPGASAGRKPHRLANGRTLSDSSYTTDDSASMDDPAASAAALPSIQNETPVPSSAAAVAASSPKKAGEREYRFSTATLLKDGKLYYQLQWDAFSEGGFTSDFFAQPEQYLTGLHQKRMSKMPALGGPGMNANLVGSANSMASQGQTSAPGQMLGQGQGQGQDPGPSPAQKAAALKAARQSFMALAKDPKALAALKAGSTGGIGQATIIGTGSFPIGSAQPILQTVPLNLSPEPASMSTAMMNLSSPRTPSPLSQSVPPPRPLQSVPVDSGSLQRNTSGKSSSTLSAPEVISADVPQAIVKPGKPSMPAGGAASLSSPQAPRPAVDRPPVAATAIVPAPVPAKKNRLFGTRFKVSSSAKKSNRLSTTVNSPVLAAGSQLSKKKKAQGGMVGKDGFTKTQESLDEVFPWTVVEHMTGQESGWVMLEPVQDGAVGWIKIDKLEEEMARLTEKQQQRQMMMQREP
ncbi:hypothetical protein BGZ95_009552 [Linnemannia exigua]|uniref:Rho-GAP domain-containing protein n=1 Tax=Linnemannia exigua TaxID=604196 RepID=A0AAD4H5L8_9FUNG|nr:hypothetical protein BGZ95_009552 [Linnemannia exigua]